MTAVGGDTLQVRWFAGARAAAGTPAETAGAAPEESVRTVLARLAADRPGLGRVLPACSFLLDGVSARADAPVGTATTLDVLPPFSGG
ncbi:MoaD/ThiS family protein [Aquipuribacter sp. SD81]|uniref:MoaD/ThiS family protein n=1 Tax=Aquipuribacter sp. SD81 TaxID=3127703 RepID=UPI00301A9E99